MPTPSEYAIMAIQPVASNAPQPVSLVPTPRFTGNVATTRGRMHMAPPVAQNPSVMQALQAVIALTRKDPEPAQPRRRSARRPDAGKW